MIRRVTGITDLEQLLESAEPSLDAEEYVFVSTQATYGEHTDWQPLATFNEDEGLTFIVRRSVADASGLDYEETFRRITLQVHSSLSAVGLTAAFSAALAEHDISANVMAAFYHDHIFVPAEDAERAMTALGSLAER